MIRPDELIVDNFAGGGGASEGIERALGRPIDIAINHDREALSMHAANHPRTRHLLEDVWDVDIEAVTDGRPVGLAWFSPDCFVPGTLVLTSAGLKPIEEVEVGDLVLTHKNRWRRATSAMTHEAPETVTVRGYGHYGLTTTPSHGFYSKAVATRYPGRKGHKASRPSAYKELSNICWPEAKSMEGKIWATPRAVPSLPMPVPNDVALSRDFFYFLGLYIGDGSIARAKENRGGDAITTGDIDLSCNKDEFAGLKAYFEAHPLTDGNGECISPRERNGDGATAAHLVWGKQSLADWLAVNIGWSCETKLLPLWCLGLQREWRQAILDGYVRADGHECARTETTTVSKALAIGIRLLAVSLDYDVALYFSPGRDGIIQGREVKGSDVYRVCWRPDNQQITTLSDWRHAFYPVREVAESGRKLVVSLQVEEDESFIADGIVVHNCTHHSKARGGKPRSKKIRGLAWLAVKWAERKRPRVIALENVEEFQSWCPLLENGQPDWAREGETFRLWCARLRGLSYTLDFREERAHEHGAPTIRKRLFVIARCDGRPIVWPKKTHGPGLEPYRTAADCIDWSIPCPSIFLIKDEARAIGVKRPLADATMRRIARGVKRYVIEAAEPFIVNLTHQGGDRVQSMSEPFKTVTGAHRGEKALITPFLAGLGGRMGQSPERSTDAPYHTITSKADTALIAPTLIQTGYGEREGQAPRAPGLDKPLGTVVAGGGKHALVAAFVSAFYGAKHPEGDARGASLRQPLATQPTENRHALVAGFLAQHNTGMIGHSPNEPVSTIVGKGCTQAVVASHIMKMRGTNVGSSTGEPLHTVSAGGTHQAEVRAFLMKYYGTDQDPQLGEPLHTVTSRDRFGLVTVQGEQFCIVDIGMRMLTPRELFRAQGFGDDYVIEYGIDAETGRAVPLTKTAQVRMCGNSVCPPVAEAIVRANFSGKAREAAA